MFFFHNTGPHIQLEWCGGAEVYLDCRPLFHLRSSLPQTSAAAERRVKARFCSGLVWARGLNTFERNFFCNTMKTVFSSMCKERAAGVREGERWRTELCCSLSADLHLFIAYSTYSRARRRHKHLRLRASFILLHTCLSCSLTTCHPGTRCLSWLLKTSVFF